MSSIFRYRFTSLGLFGQDLEGFEHDESRDDGVGGGDGRNDIARHGLDVESRLALNVEDLGANVGASRDKVHGRLIVLVPHQMITFAFGLELALKSEDARLEHLETLLNRPHGLILDIVGLAVIAGLVGGWICQSLDINGHGGLAFAPELLHAQQVLDIVEKEFLEQGRGLVAEILGPLSGGNSDDIAILPAAIAVVGGFRALFR